MDVLPIELMSIVDGGTIAILLYLIVREQNAHERTRAVVTAILYKLTGITESEKPHDKTSNPQSETEKEARHDS